MQQWGGVTDQTSGVIRFSVGGEDGGGSGSQAVFTE